MRALYVAVAWTSLCCAALSLAGCKTGNTALPHPVALRADGMYKHPASGMSFPAAVGDFRRVALLRYDTGGLDVSAGYDLGPPFIGIAATVYVYPAPQFVAKGSPDDVVAAAKASLCRSEFERRKREIVETHRGAALRQEKPVSVAASGAPFPGMMAEFAYEDAFRGSRQQLSSALYVFCYVGGTWAFEYRFTSPGDVAASEKIADFMTALRWTVPQRP